MIYNLELMEQQKNGHKKSKKDNTARNDILIYKIPYIINAIRICNIYMQVPYEVHGINLYYKKLYEMGAEKTTVRVGSDPTDYGSAELCAEVKLAKHDSNLPLTINCAAALIGSVVFINTEPLPSVADFKLYHITLNTPNAYKFIREYSAD